MCSMLTKKKTPDPCLRVYFGTCTNRNSHPDVFLKVDYLNFPVILISGNW